MRNQPSIQITYSRPPGTSRTISWVIPKKVTVDSALLGIIDEKSYENRISAEDFVVVLEKWRMQKGGDVDMHLSPRLPPEPTEVSRARATKKCPACTELIKLEAIKCRFCGETLDPAEVARQVSKAKNEDSFENRVLCSDGSCIGVVGTDGRCKMCGKPYKTDDY
ncbi:MAG: hypothetical protein WAZ60_07185 [Desulfosalsimonadaceae bacterium]